MKISLKMLSAICKPFCSGLNIHNKALGSHKYRCQAVASTDLQYSALVQYFFNNPVFINISWHKYHTDINNLTQKKDATCSPQSWLRFRTGPRDQSCCALESHTAPTCDDPGTLGTNGEQGSPESSHKLAKSHHCTKLAPAHLAMSHYNSLRASDISSGQVNINQNCTTTGIIFELG